MGPVFRPAKTLYIERSPNGSELSFTLPPTRQRGGTYTA